MCCRQEEPAMPSRKSPDKISRFCCRWTSCDRARRTSSSSIRGYQDTNRGVVALCAELDERADHLRRADELKSKFLSHMVTNFAHRSTRSWRCRRLLLTRSDGELTTEQETQVRFIRAAENLTELVDDLLDLAKVEAGKTVVVPSRFAVTSLLARCAACCGHCWSAMPWPWCSKIQMTCHRSTRTGQGVT